MDKIDNNNYNIPLGRLVAACDVIKKEEKQKEREDNKEENKKKTSSKKTNLCREKREKKRDRWRNVPTSSMPEVFAYKEYDFYAGYNGKEYKGPIIRKNTENCIYLICKIAGHDSTKDYIKALVEYMRNKSVVDIHCGYMDILYKFDCVNDYISSCLRLDIEEEYDTPEGKKQIDEYVASRIWKAYSLELLEKKAKENVRTDFIIFLRRLYFDHLEPIKDLFYEKKIRGVKKLLISDENAIRAIWHLNVVIDILMDCYGIQFDELAPGDYDLEHAGQGRVFVKEKKTSR